MKQLALNLSINEQKLFTRLFPKGYDVRKLDRELRGNELNEYLSYPNINMKLTTAIRLAIKMSDHIIIDPKSWNRRNDNKDSNLPSKGKRKTIPMSDSEWNTIELVQAKYFIDRTLSDAVVWAMYNYQAILSINPDLVNDLPQHRSEPTGLDDSNSRVITLRLPVEVFNQIQVNAAAQGISNGKLMRDIICNHFIGLSPKKLSIPSDDFDYDLEV